MVLRGKKHNVIHLEKLHYKIFILCITSSCTSLHLHSYSKLHSNIILFLKSSKLSGELLRILFFKYPQRKKSQGAMLEKWGGHSQPLFNEITLFWKRPSSTSVTSSCWCAGAPSCIYHDCWKLQLSKWNWLQTPWLTVE